MPQKKHPEFSFLVKIPVKFKTDHIVSPEELQKNFPGSTMEEKLLNFVLYMLDQEGIEEVISWREDLIMESVSVEIKED